MQNARLDEARAGIKISRRNSNKLRKADDTTLMAESEEELMSLLMNFPQSFVIHTAKGFSIVNEAEVYALLEFSCFSMTQQMLAF